VVPKLLHLPPSDPGVRNDDELFALLSFLCGEVRTMLAEHVTDWRKFSASCVAEPRIWESFFLAVGFRSPSPSRKLNAMRGSFYYILESLETLREKYPEGPALSSVTVYGLSEAVGSFTASYYNWCEAQGVLSERMKRLDRTLATGV
jgi:hypothetical protein